MFSSASFFPATRRPYFRLFSWQKQHFRFFFFLYLFQFLILGNWNRIFKLFPTPPRLISSNAHSKVARIHLNFQWNYILIVNTSREETFVRFRSTIVRFEHFQTAQKKGKLCLKTFSTFFFLPQNLQISIKLKAFFFMTGKAFSLAWRFHLKVLKLQVNFLLPNSKPSHVNWRSKVMRGFCPLPSAPPEDNLQDEKLNFWTIKLFNFCWPSKLLKKIKAHNKVLFFTWDLKLCFENWISSHQFKNKIRKAFPRRFFVVHKKGVVII